MFDGVEVGRVGRQKKQMMSPSGTKPARGERFKTGHSEVWDLYHFWFFNQGIFGAS
jgi:hypothetical protein